MKEPTDIELIWKSLSKLDKAITQLKQRMTVVENTLNEIRCQKAKDVNDVF